MPLLSLRLCGRIGLMALMLTACSFHQTPPAFTATGYIADRGAVRLWRKDDTASERVTLESVYSPYRGADTVVTRYEYQQGEVRQIRRQQSGEQPETVQLRFDQQGKLSFMQRERGQRRESLSDDETALYAFEARRVLEISQALRAGQVRLKQGIWHNGVITLCQGGTATPDFDARAAGWLAGRTRNASGDLGIAWLDAPEGTQLLLVANENFCRWQPNENDL
ncbi:Putative lipoprotein [Sodalis praecaptivus]|uniref:Putative lipoprotein n=2 Tax=Bruguierivoracaceae TaxID=2812006 RepID=W0HYD2_9GAMM|nr:DUF1481 domain-containing protein [Sodalis praecaptivus]AHF78876.1 Putative lipoprotein [Sodalis praecaptivus]